MDYQSKNVSPFDTHPIHMWIFFAATSIYCLGLSTKIELKNDQPNYSKIIISKMILCSGALSSLALASIFLPRLLGWLCLGSWTIFPTLLARPFIYQTHEWLKHSIVTTISLTRERFNIFCRCITMKNEHLPM